MPLDPECLIGGHLRFGNSNVLRNVWSYKSATHQVGLFDKESEIVHSNAPSHRRHTVCVTSARYYIFVVRLDFEILRPADADLLSQHTHSDILNFARISKGTERITQPQQIVLPFLTFAKGGICSPEFFHGGVGALLTALNECRSCAFWTATVAWVAATPSSSRSFGFRCCLSANPTAIAPSSAFSPICRVAAKTTPGRPGSSSERS